MLRAAWGTPPTQQHRPAPRGGEVGRSSSRVTFGFSAWGRAKSDARPAVPRGAPHRLMGGGRQRHVAGIGEATRRQPTRWASARGARSPHHRGGEGGTAGRQGAGAGRSRWQGARGNKRTVGARRQGVAGLVGVTGHSARQRGRAAPGTIAALGGAKSGGRTSWGGVRLDRGRTRATQPTGRRAHGTPRLATPQRWPRPAPSRQGESRRRPVAARWPHGRKAGDRAGRRGVEKLGPTLDAMPTATAIVPHPDMSEFFPIWFTSAFVAVPDVCAGRASRHFAYPIKGNRGGGTNWT